jgi:hypothetical protein
LRTSEKIAIAELRSCGCGAAFFLKVADLRLRKRFLQVAELRLRTQKKVALAHLCSLVATPDCKPAVPDSNLAIAPAYSGLPFLRWAAIWDGISLGCPLRGIRGE